MKLLESVKDKLGNETIGNYGFDKERPNEKKEVKKEVKKEIKKKKQPDKPSKKTPPKDKNKKVEKQKKIDEDVYDFIPIIEEDNFRKPEKIDFFSKEIHLENKTYPVLDLLGIARNVNVNGLVTSEDIENTEFSLTAPTGIDPSEVERFCALLEHDISRYRAIIETRQQDFELLLKEVIKLEQELVDKQQESELANFIIDQKSSEERLKEELIELRLENQELKHKLSSFEEKQAKEKPRRPEFSRKKSPNQEKKFSKSLQQNVKNEENSFDDLLRELGE